MDALLYVSFGFLITESCVWCTALFFDAMHNRFQKYKIRPGHDLSPELKQVAIQERLSKYKTEWVIYALTWFLSRMSFSSQPPGWGMCVAQAVLMGWMLDVWIYLTHTCLSYRVQIITSCIITTSTRT
eukprot:TRINITY_DN10020_c0_g2_i1.p1 TRINITY_DN10020_c0_g2~~TRINITY_DN10020_c0_g2_i1.p1  ORF type:complete len:128 (-),score=1.73 TRINITY_DN10020_c0_g2_i1:202-585(-)